MTVIQSDTIPLKYKTPVLRIRPVALFYYKNCPFVGMAMPGTQIVNLYCSVHVYLALWRGSFPNVPWLDSAPCVRLASSDLMLHNISAELLITVDLQCVNGRLVALF